MCLVAAGILECACQLSICVPLHRRPLQHAIREEHDLVGTVWEMGCSLLSLVWACDNTRDAFVTSTSSCLATLSRCCRCPGRPRDDAAKGRGRGCCRGRGRRGRGMGRPVVPKEPEEAEDDELSMVAPFQSNFRTRSHKQALLEFPITR